MGEEERMLEQALTQTVKKIINRQMTQALIIGSLLILVSSGGIWNELG